MPLQENLHVLGGKDGNCFVVNSTNMRHVGGQVQTFRCVDPNNARPGQTHNVHNGMVSWRDPNNTVQVYVWGETISAAAGTSMARPSRRPPIQ